MHDFVQAISTAFTLIGSLDPEIAGVVALSLGVSLSASLIAMVIGAPIGGALAEVGAIIIVGGNIRGFTRTMTTSIVLETGKGELTLALGLGIVLVLLSLIVSAGAFLLNAWADRQ